MAEYEVEVTARVSVRIKDGTTAITRATENIDGFHDYFAPGITTEDAVLKHLAVVAVLFGVRDASNQDGWADLERGDVTMMIMDAHDEQVVVSGG